MRLSLDKGKIASVELDGERLRPGGVGGFYLREPNSAKRVPMVGNAVSKDGKLQLTLTSPLQAKVSAVLTEGDGFIEVAGELENLTSTDRGLWLGFNLPVDTSGWKWGQTLSTSPVIEDDNPAYAEGNNLVPIPAVWTDQGGIALCIPPTNPCVFEVGADADGVRIQMAFGLSKDTTKFPSKAAFRFRIYAIDGTWGFRDALAKYYDWYPEYYHIEPRVMTTLNHHHDWIGMNYVSERFRTDRQINPDVKEYMAYTKTSARIQGMKDPARIKTHEQILDAIAKAVTIQHYEKNGNANSELLKEGRAALINSVCYDPDGSFGRFKARRTVLIFLTTAIPIFLRTRAFRSTLHVPAQGR